MRIKQAFSLPRGGGVGGRVLLQNTITSVELCLAVQFHVCEFCLNFKPTSSCTSRYRQLRQIPYGFFRCYTKGRSKIVVSIQYLLLFLNISSTSERFVLTTFVASILRRSRLFSRHETTF